MQYVSLIDPIQDSDWDRFVEGHPFGWLYHSSDWKKVLESTFPQLTGYYLTLRNKNDDVITSALPLFLVTSRCRRNRFVSIPFTTICDPLVSNFEEMGALLEETFKLSKDFYVKHIEIRTLNAHTFIKESGGEYDRSYVQQYVVLDETPQELWHTFHKKAIRRRINKALKSGLILRIAQDEADLEIFYQLYFNTRKRLGLPVHPYRFFKSLWQTFYFKKQLSLCLVEYNGKMIAGGIVFKYKNRVSFEFIGSDNKFNHVFPNHFLYWQIIKSSYEEGFKVVDFGRTALSNQGLIAFKYRWGAKIKEMPIYYYPKIVGMDIKPRESTQTYQLIRTINRHLPKFAYNIMSNFYYRHAS